MKEARHKQHAVRFHLYKIQKSGKLTGVDRSPKTVVSSWEAVTRGGTGASWGSSNTASLNANAGRTSVFNLGKLTGLYISDMCAFLCVLYFNSLKMFT